MKKYLLLVLTGFLLVVSCSKDEGTPLEKGLVGKWIFDNEACISQKQYTELYRNFYPDATIDETIYHNPANMAYGQWVFSDHEVSWFYKYVSGKTQSNHGSYRIQDDNILYVGATPYNIIELNKDKLTIQICDDTVYFYDENYEKQIAWEEMWTLVLNKEEL